MMCWKEKRMDKSAQDIVHIDYGLSAVAHKPDTQDKQL